VRKRRCGSGRDGSGAAAIAAIYTRPSRTASPPWNEDRTPRASAGSMAAPHDTCPVASRAASGRLGTLTLQPPRAYDHVADFSLTSSGTGGARGGARACGAASLGHGSSVPQAGLSAFPWNAPGMALYQKHGFRTVGTYTSRKLDASGWIRSSWKDPLARIIHEGSSEFSRPNEPNEPILQIPMAEQRLTRCHNPSAGLPS